MRTLPHQADGSGLRQHSVGGCFPYIVIAIGNGDSHEYAVQNPAGEVVNRGYADYDEAYYRAVYLKACDKLPKPFLLGSTDLSARERAHDAAERGEW